MTDTWITLGSLVSDPNLTNILTAAGPDFNRTGATIQWGGGAPEEVRATAGAFIAGPTESVRDALNSYFQQVHGADRVPVSLYTAGQICKLVRAPAKNGYTFLDAMARTGARFRQAVTLRGATVDQKFLSLVGLTMVDYNIRQMVQNLSFGHVLSDLNVSPTRAQIAVLQDTIRPFQDGSAEMGEDPRDSDDWSHCREVFIYYEGFERVPN